jgi:hypothetical protein
MLSPEEYAQAQGAIAAAETEIASLTQLRRDCIEKAREYNDQTKACTSKITALDRMVAPARAMVAEYNAEQKRQQAERLKVERAAQEQAAAAAAKAKEESDLAKAAAKIQELEAALAAKG